MIDFSHLSNAHQRALELVREIATAENCRPYLVGGPVRDLLLGRSAFDLDIALEGDSSTLARALAKHINGRVKSFPQFLTYKVTSHEMPEIDIATARKEKYRKPGALPSVSRGHLRDDLLRRDFSINAMALDLIDSNLHDPTNGERDLTNRLVRVLHDQSLLDDPTRVFRATRIACRLGFEIEPHTADLIRKAIDSGAMTTISKERVWHELFLAMDEADAAKILVATSKAGALEVLFGKRQIDERQLEIVQNLVPGNPELDRYVLYTSALLRGDASPIELEGSGFSQKRARNVMQIANETGQFTDALREAKNERQRLRILKHASPEMLSVLRAAYPDEHGHLARFENYRTFTIPLRGNDLNLPPGPHISRALERTREAVFTGEIVVDEARAFALQLAERYLSGSDAAKA